MLHTSSHRPRCLRPSPRTCCLPCAGLKPTTAVLSLNRLLQPNFCCNSVVTPFAAAVKCNIDSAGHDEPGCGNQDECCEPRALQVLLMLLMLLMLMLMLLMLMMLLMLLMLTMLPLLLLHNTPPCSSDTKTFALTPAACPTPLLQCLAHPPANLPLARPT
jgi:hypothetical protein